MFALYFALLKQALLSELLQAGRERMAEAGRSNPTRSPGRFCSPWPGVRVRRIGSEPSLSAQVTSKATPLPMGFIRFLMDSSVDLRDEVQELTAVRLWSLKVF